MGISMDFIVGLPKSRNKSVIIVVFNDLSKYAHFCALKHPFTTFIVAKLFMENIFKLHGCLILLFFIKVQLLPTIYGKHYSGSKEPNYMSSHPIIPRMMAKWKGSTKFWKHILGVLHPTENINGFSGYH
jgi:hypothetical protein